jgi:D-amino-acid dehydrogenase
VSGAIARRLALRLPSIQKKTRAMKSDALVLGAGMVGISAALALQARGRSVVLVDRRPAAEETSYGNAGLIQREGVVPYGFPRAWRVILKSALNQTTQSNLHWGALPWIAPDLYRYWRNGTPARIAATSQAAVPLVERCLDEHEDFMKAAGSEHLVRRTGYLKVFRDEALLAAELDLDAKSRRVWGVESEVKTEAELRLLEPALQGRLAGGILLPQPWSVSDPSALGKSYARLFVERGGQFLTADAGTLERTADGWQVQRVEGAIQARDVVVALGPWSGAVLRRVGVRLPFFVKRGYHMHFRPAGNAVPTRPMVDGDHGYLLTSMARGIRLTTGAEFTRHDAAPTPVQLGKVEPMARALFPLGQRVDPAPWLGARPCLPDMLPMIGPVPGKPGLWIDSGHHHLGFTLGPVSGRLLAEMMTGEAPFADPRPYRVDRFI